MRRKHRKGCRHDALRAAKLGQRKRVAHMATAAAEDAEGGMKI
jgi:hypothetical protein